ncbi:deoxyribodipyrimidine photo-lyase [Psychrobacter arenosus]|uniref:cryptochrome/photolyase family protein n=1 Tax=Psychrobacter arenosus TaxID=256326 RepID=UPI001918ACAC|nr:FAD-binding domain-containing protein [Psychrobacter arenosus]
MSSATASTPSTETPHYLMWFRRDLRSHDNTALAALCELAVQNKATVSAVFFITPDQWYEHDASFAQVELICRTLPLLATALQEQLNIPLQVSIAPTFNDCIKEITALCKSKTITHVAANYEYEVNELARDELLTQTLDKADIEFTRYHDQCLLPPKTVTTNDDTMYQVFTPFYKKWQAILDASPPNLHNASKVTATNGNAAVKPLAETLATITKLHEQTLATYQQFTQQTDEEVQGLLTHTHEDYPAGELAACHRLDNFVAEDINDYDISRDRPALDATSHLSAYLTIGAISPRRCYLQAQKALHAAANSDNSSSKNKNSSTDIQRWISELAWRDFYRHVIFERPDIVRHKAYKVETDAKIDWSYDADEFALWCVGKTGVPLVDAAMRCLNTTGFMPNRLRMVTAMFLTKDLLIDWRLGERYFMQQLIDGDFASNNGGWQWSASTGTDSAPYFRIMNPFSQGKTHDKDAEFIKKWLPELKDIPASMLHDEQKLIKALSKGGQFTKVEYPTPMVDHKAARLATIAAFKGE